jgi:hypothetical protein
MRVCKIKFFAESILIIATLYGCKKVINVNLDNAGIQTVITGEVTNQPGPYIVKIAKSVNYFQDNVFPPVSGAFVTITGNGLTDTLSETSPGDYSTHYLSGQPGKNYSLFVSIEGSIYTATSIMPQFVNLDSISFIGGRNNNIYAVANFQDPPGVANYYQFIEYANGTRFSNGRGNSVFEDRLSDGRYISRLLYDDSTDIKSGITLTVQMKCIDKPVYSFWYELLSISGVGGSFSNPTPANPTSNITGGALGYFSANTSTSKSIVIQ